MEERDRRDAGRSLASCVPADDAIIINTDHYTLDEMVEHVVSEIEKRI